MSLKAFHIAFVAISTLLAIFVAVWAIRELQAGGGAQAGVMLVLCGVAALGLPAYGVWFLGKTKDMSLL